MNVDSYIVPVVDALTGIMEMDQAYHDRKAIEKANRGHWEGGGFGVAGAIKGAVTASAMNLAGSAVHGVLDLASSTMQSAKVSSKKSKIFKDPQTIYVLSIALLKAYIGGFHGVRDELNNHGFSSENEVKPDNAVALSQNAIQYSSDKKQEAELLAKSIFMNPFDVNLYAQFLQRHPQKQGFQNVQKHFGIDRLLHYQITLQNEVEIKKILMKSAYSLEEKCKQIDDLCRLSEGTKIKIGQDITDILNQIVDQCGENTDKLNHAVTQLAGIRSTRYGEKVQGAVELLKKRQEEIELAAVKALIDNMPEDNGEYDVICKENDAKSERINNPKGTTSEESLFQNAVPARHKAVGGIAETVNNGTTRNNRAPKRNGCLWTVIKWILILSVISVLLSECGFENDGSGESNKQGSVEDVLTSETQAPVETVKLPEDIYDLLMTTGRSNINSLLAEEPIDIDALRFEYQFLLALKVNEYIFKASAYGYHTGDYETNKFNQIMNEAALITQEMKTYFPEEDVDTYYADTALMSYYALDETKIDYDALLVGSKKRPDVDAMWLRFVESMVESSEVDVRTAIQNHNMEVYSTLVPTEQTEVPDITEFPTEDFQPPTETVHSQEATGTVLKSSGGLNVRSGPGTDYDTVGRLQPGEAVTIYEQQRVGNRDWGNIGYGWVAMDYIVFGIDNSIVPSTGTSNDLRSEYYGLWVSDDRQWCMTITPNGNRVDITVEQYYSPNGVSRWTMTGDFEENIFIRYSDGTLTDYVDGSVSYSYGGCEGAIGLYGNAVEWTEFFDDLGTSTSMMLTRTDRYSNPYS